ncbi:cell division protein FtsK [Solwaraspora sp. WMMA2056]|uniref:cell division protein FtsK n=1 Tax=Solwaraspora sp. WMMA2056 TaxID=3015161 RepID=UPI00259BCB82|nr:cell division protein FtsK [Solwaraspora sp. WMMA2056]WJK41204.1 cell division protein FtsK [Solwaraspora sp. WMMA2056]
MGIDLDRAAALHRSAAAGVAALTLTGHHPAAGTDRPGVDRDGVDRDGADRAGADRNGVDPGTSQHEIAEQLRSLAARLAPGWWGAPLDAQTPALPLGDVDQAGHVRIGIAQPLDDARFPVVVPLLGTGHLAVDGDVRDRRVAGLLRALVLRLLAAVPQRRLTVRAVDGIATVPGGVLAPFGALIDAGVLRPAATQTAGLRSVLAEAEQWIRPARPTVARHHRHGRFMVLVIASLPEDTEGVDLDRIARLAQAGPEHGLHLVVAGWPPPPLSLEQTRADLPRSTTVRLRNPHVLVGDPPGEAFGDPASAGPGRPGGLAVPVYLDADPPHHLVDRVSAELAAAGPPARPTLTELLPDPATGCWTESAADGLVVVAGFDGHRQVPLGLTDVTPHWLVAGEAGAGVAEFLVDVLYGLAVRYPPDELTVHLVDLSPGESFAGVMSAAAEPGGPPQAESGQPPQAGPAWLPHVASVGVEADPEYGLSVLRLLAAEVERRTWLAGRSGSSRFADLAAHARIGRVLCVIKDPGPLLDRSSDTAADAVDLLDRIARGGRGCGVHLVLADSTGGRPADDTDSGTAGPAEPAAGAPWWQDDTLRGHFPVRVALPGGDWLLEPDNDAAAGLPLGSAVVNTAGGLGGPRGATRGHERTVAFPDPYADRPELARLRRQLWSRADPQAGPPQVFAGYAEPMSAAGASKTGDGTGPPVCRLGRAVELPERAAEFRFERAPGRHLAIFGSRTRTAELLATAVISLAGQHEPGTGRLILVSFGEHDRPQLDSLAAAVDGRLTTEIVDLDVLRTLGDTSGPAYLIIATADVLELGGPAAARLRNLLDSGPARGVHLLSCWERVDPFVAFLGPSPELIAGIVLLDLPVAADTGGPDRLPPWRPRDRRGLLYDAQTDRRTVFVPYGRGTVSDHGEVPS